MPSLLPINGAWFSNAEQPAIFHPDRHSQASFATSLMILNILAQTQSAITGLARSFAMLPHFTQVASDKPPN